MHYIMNGEYAGFFDIGMVQRNEANAIIVHGTMCLIRRAAMDMAGGWAGDTICEDTDLGLAIIEHGWLTHYTNQRYGHGLLPDTYEAFKKQRHRWAYGGFQIVKKHWRRFLPGASRLSPDQRREFALGWLNWLGAESLGVLVAILNLIWVPIVAFADIAIPDKILTLPIIAAFVVSLVHFVALYRLRVPTKWGQMLGAMVAAMSVQWTVSRAVANGLITEHLPFARTRRAACPGCRSNSRRSGKRSSASCCWSAPPFWLSPTTTRKSARSTCSPPCWCSRACRSCRRWRSPFWKIRGSTISRSGAVPDPDRGADRLRPVAMPTVVSPPSRSLRGPPGSQLTGTDFACGRA
jgi:hypothetical protein